ncbi:MULTISPECIES: hypothetical protein [Pseudomonas]|uniref:DUF7831 domain-containing protein n=1 Tax=Pseudomonas quercus TaxID=2722792 RepID=A0ABX0YJB4_9PSED|nr:MULTISPECIES: hypothetical protein [Pseudomonas]MBF7144964.1 hypothetical protein [Pseudomonas sp. LY10J]NJP03556.1 hypothetical protein [Pseudomonas quercus]
MRRFLIEEYETIDVDVLRANRDQVYAVELTLDGQICAGTMDILAEPNTCGIPVCNAILNEAHVPFSDQDTEHEALRQALRKLYKLALGRTLRVPKAGIGAGPTGLEIHSPHIYRDLCQILADHFGYRQPSTMTSAHRPSDNSSHTYHYELFTEVCKRGGYYMASVVAQKHGLSLDQLKAHCLAAGKELDAQGRLFTLHLPTYRWASEG